MALIACVAVWAEKKVRDAQSASEKEAADKIAAEQIIADLEAKEGDQDCKGYSHLLSTGLGLAFARRAPAG